MESGLSTGPICAAKEGGTSERNEIAFSALQFRRHLSCFSRIQVVHSARRRRSITTSCTSPTQRRMNDYQSGIRKINSIEAGLQRLQDYEHSPAVNGEITTTLNSLKVIIANLKQSNSTTPQYALAHRTQSTQLIRLPTANLRIFKTSTTNSRISIPNCNDKLSSPPLRPPPNRIRGQGMRSGNQTLSRARIQIWIIIFSKDRPFFRIWPCKGIR